MRQKTRIEEAELSVEQRVQIRKNRMEAYQRFLKREAEKQETAATQPEEEDANLVSRSTEKQM